MKKITLLFTLTILCAGVLNGMEPEPNLGNLPKDIHHEIVRQAIESSKTLDDAIKAIKVACVLQGACYKNLKDFTKLVHVLANKFNTSTEKVAEKLNEKKISFAGTYLQLADLLANFGIHQSIEEFKSTLNALKHADFNCTFANPGSKDEGTSILTLAIAKKQMSTEKIQLLLDFGANPNIKDKFGMTALEWVEKYIRKDDPRYEQIIKILKEKLQ